MNEFMSSGYAKAGTENIKYNARYEMIVGPKWPDNICLENE